jgi:hypothetical protein
LTFEEENGLGESVFVIVVVQVVTMVDARARGRGREAIGEKQDEREKGDES